MARPREFDEADVVDKAMEVFWAKGFAATSLNDLLRAMELSKSSFYDTFGSKQALFLATLDRYAETKGRQVRAVLTGPLPGREAIARAFGGPIEKAEAKAKGCACYYNRCASEVAGQDIEAARRIAKGMENMDEAFAAAVARGQADGSITSRRAPESLGAYLNAAFQGLVLTATSGRTPAQLRESVEITLSALD